MAKKNQNTTTDVPTTNYLDLLEKFNAILNGLESLTIDLRGRENSANTNHSSNSDLHSAQPKEMSHRDRCLLEAEEKIRELQVDMQNLKFKIWIKETSIEDERAKILDQIRALQKSIELIS